MSKIKNSIRTSKRVAKKASRLLRDGRLSKKTKGVVASCLVNRKKKS